MSDDNFLNLNAQEEAFIRAHETLSETDKGAVHALLQAYSVVEQDSSPRGGVEAETVSQEAAISPARELQECFERMGDENRATLLRAAQALLHAHLNNTRKVSLTLVAGGQGDDEK